MTSIIQSLLHHASHFPDHIAFREGDSGQHVTYRQLLERIRQLASILTAHQITCVGLEMENGIDWIVADLTCLYANIVCVPIPLFFSPEQKQHVIRQSGMNYLFSLRDSASDNERIAEIGRLSLYRLAPDAFRLNHILPGTAKLTFTSGSTGSPKGVCLSAHHLDRVTDSLCQSIPPFNGQDSHLVSLPLSTLLENMAGVYIPLKLGTPVTVTCGEQIGLMGSSRFEPQLFAKALAHYQPSSLVITPAILMALVHLVEQQQDLASSLKFVAVGGAKVVPALLDKAHQLGIPAYEGYGLSECGSVVCLNTPEAVRHGTSGKVLPHAKVQIAEDGEICVSGAIALGYLNEPFSSPWLPTGDIGRLTDDGYLVVTGRKKNQIITSFGRNISPEWVEMQGQKWPEISHMVVVGEARANLAAMILGTDAERIRTTLGELNQSLPDYARIGAFVLIHEAEKFYSFFTANGRPIRSAVETMVDQQLNQEHQSDVHVYALN